MGRKKRRCKVLTAVFSAVRLWGQVHIHKQMFKQYTHNSCPLLNGSWMWYCSCHSSHVMSVSHSAGTLRKLLCTPDTLQSNAHGKRCTKVMQAPSVLFFLFFLLPPHTHARIHTETDTHAHTQWDKSWGNGCPCFVGPPVHPGYKSEDPVRVNPLCGREPGSCVCVCVCVYMCVCVRLRACTRERWHRPVWNVPHEWQTGSGCPAGREQSPLLDYHPRKTHNTHTRAPNPVHVPSGASLLPISH